MEGAMKQWKEDEEAEVEQVGLVKRQAHMHVTSTTITTSKFDVQATEQTNGSSGLNEKQELIGTEVDSGDIQKKTTLHPLDPLTSVDSTFLSNVRTESERLGIIKENVQQEKELYLESLYQKTTTQEFYCPNCKVCIQKVLLVDTVKEETSAPALPPPPPSPDRFRCSSCFSFLIPIGSWLFRGLVQDHEVSAIEGQAPETPQITVQVPDEVNTHAAGSGKIILRSRQVKNDLADKASQEEDDKARGKSEQQPNLKGIRVDEGSTELSPSITIDLPIQPGTGSNHTWEILKSIVYGGLVESIASLGIVISSASSDATTLNIVVLSLANLIGGLFVLVHNIWDLRYEQPRTNNETTNTRVDQYYQVLGKREHFYLHVFIAILSFLIFGLVPPLVYAFTFSESNYKDLKLAAVALASAICIALLSISKAYIQRPNTYLKTVLHYLSTGAMTSVVSYLAGKLVKELIEKLGWFDTTTSSFTLLQPEMSVQKPRFGSY